MSALRIPMNSWKWVVYHVNFERVLVLTPIANISENLNISYCIEVLTKYGEKHAFWLSASTVSRKYHMYNVKRPTSRPLFEFAACFWLYLRSFSRYLPILALGLTIIYNYHLETIWCLKIWVYMHKLLCQLSPNFGFMNWRWHQKIMRVQKMGTRITDSDRVKLENIKVFA